MPLQPGDDAARRSPPAIGVPVGRRGLVTGRGMPTSPPDVKIEVASSFAPPHSLVSGAAGRAGIEVQRRRDRGVGISSVGSDSSEAEPGDVRKGMNGRGNDYWHPKTTFTHNVVSHGDEAQSPRASNSDTRYESPGEVGSSEEETTAEGGDKVPANGGGARLPSRNRKLIGNGLINYSAFPERLAPAPEASRSAGDAAIAVRETGEPLEALAQDEATVARLKVATRYEGDYSPALTLSAQRAGWGMRQPASHQRASGLAAREGDAGWEIGAAALEEDGDVGGVESGERGTGSRGSAGGLREDEDNDGEEWAEATQKRVLSPCSVLGMFGFLVVVAAVGCLLAFGGTCLREGHAHWMCVDMSEGGGYLMVGGALFLAACAVCCCGCALCVQEQTVRDSSEGIVSAGDNSGALVVAGGSEREVGARAIGAGDPGGYVADIQDVITDVAPPREV